MNDRCPLVLSCEEIQRKNKTIGYLRHLIRSQHRRLMRAQDDVKRLKEIVLMNHEEMEKLRGDVKLEATEKEWFKNIGFELCSKLNICRNDLDDERLLRNRETTQLRESLGVAERTKIAIINSASREIMRLTEENQILREIRLKP